MTNDRANYRSVIAAAATAGLLMLLFGLAYRTLASCLIHPVRRNPVPQDSLQAFPWKIADWQGETLEMDDAIVRRTDTDAHVSRQYSRKAGGESITLFIGCSFSECDRVIHRPENCYTGSGWTTLETGSTDLRFDADRELPCTLYKFSRGDLKIEYATVLHYYIVDGRLCGTIYEITPKLWRLRRNVGYVARVLITTSGSGPADDAAEKMVSEFAVDSAPFITRLLATLAAERRADESKTDSEGK